VLRPFSGCLNNFIRVDAEVIRKIKLVDYVRRLCDQSELRKRKISSQSVLYTRDPNGLNLTMETARCYGTPVQTSYTKLYNNQDNNALGNFKFKTLEHDSTYQLYMKTVMIIFIFHRPLPPFPLRSKTSCLHKSASVPLKTNTIGRK
jgi:hypothetical protein